MSNFHVSGGLKWSNFLPAVFRVVAATSVGDDRNIIKLDVCFSSLGILGGCCAVRNSLMVAHAGRHPAH